jgi:hypothetical protein
MLADFPFLISVPFSECLTIRTESESEASQNVGS